VVGEEGMWPLKRRAQAPEPGAREGQTEEADGEQQWTTDRGGTGVVGEGARG
jgi:hypothetical protein